MRLIQFLFIAFLLLTTVSCMSYSDDELTSFDKEIKAYLKEKNIECERSSSGLYYKIIEQGDGPKIQYKDFVKFQYKGELVDGEVFDELGEPLEFQVEQLIAAWQEIMLELNEGGKAFLVAPPSLGYGSHELEDIPPNSILVYNLEVLEIK